MSSDVDLCAVIVAVSIMGYCTRCSVLFSSLGRTAGLEDGP